jgi:hypothetical protein
MPGWVLLISPDSLNAHELEQQVRLAGFSPRRAPDAARSEVLLRQGERPEALVIALSSSPAGLQEARALASRARTRLIAISKPAIAAEAERAGALVVSIERARDGGLAAALTDLHGGA